MAVRIGKDPWIGCGNAHRLPIELKIFLRVANITHIGHIADLEHTTLFQQALKLAQRLNIPQQWTQQWNAYIGALTKAHIQLGEGEDEVIWDLSKAGKYTLKEGYLVLVEARRPQSIMSQWKHLQKLKVSPRNRLIMWTILKNKFPIGDNLLK